MATVENFPGRLPAANANERAYRAPPLNLEAEQALLGAILVNNDAYDRISDFLKPEHFVEEIHRRIFEIAGSLIRAGKLASPITLKTFLGEHDLGGVTVQQYLARLAADATTIINALDYGRTIHDLAVRREPCCMNAKYSRFPHLSATYTGGMGSNWRSLIAHFRFRFKMHERTRRNSSCDCIALRAGFCSRCFSP